MLGKTIGMIIGLVLMATSPYIDTKDDIDVLYRIVEAEATGGTYEQKKNVASCVVNRRESEDFPNTITDVVFERGQFTPISDGRYYTVMITKDTRKAVNEILLKGPEHKCYFFCSDKSESYRTGWFSTLREEFFDGEHHYFTGAKK